MKINENGLKLLKEFEGCRLTAYRDVGKLLTIGWGHTGSEVIPGLTISQEKADKLLADDLMQFEEGVTKALTAKNVNPNQFSAMVVFAYNVGLANFKMSTLLRCMNKGNPSHAAQEFLRWNKVHGEVVAGLTRRRQAERALFLLET